MLTIEQLNRLQIHELSPRAKKDRQYRIVKRVVADGKWYDYDELQLQWQWPLVASLHSYSNEASGRIAHDSRVIRNLVKDNRWRI